MSGNLRTVAAGSDGALALAQYRRDAGRYRAAWLAGIAAGMFTVLDAVEVAASDDAASPLRSMRIDRLLAAQPGWSRRRVVAAMDRLRVLATHEGAPGRVLDVPEHPKVRWLMHSQASDARMLLLRDVIADRGDVQLWPGFPYTPRPRP